jgi:hypothetical protein
MPAATKPDAATKVEEQKPSISVVPDYQPPPNIPGSGVSLGPKISYAEPKRRFFSWSFSILQVIVVALAFSAPVFAWTAKEFYNVTYYIVNGMMNMYGRPVAVSRSLRNSRAEETTVTKSVVD